MVGSKPEHYGTLEVFRLTGNRLREAKFPGLTDDQDEGYAGRDVYRVTDDGVERDFPLYRDSPEGVVATGQHRALKYKMIGGRWKKAGEEIRDAEGRVVK